MSSKAGEGSSVTKRPKRFIAKSCFWRFYWQAWQLSWKAPYTSWKRASSWFLCQYYWNFRVSNSVFYMTNGSRDVQCGNFIILLSLRFYVKSILGYSRWAKSAIWTHLEALNFCFCAFLHFLKAEITKFTKI